MRAMSVLQLKEGKRYKDLMLGLNEAIDHLAMAKNFYWYGHVVRRENGRVL